jgi:osmoprotectant transport system permease protein
VVIGAKKFTESVILAEMGTQLARAAGAEARRDDLGGTPALWLALTQGDIDAYVEYTGTITRQILKADPPDLAAALAARGVVLGRPLGFRNNYALGMRKDVAAAKGITKISDLRGHAELRLGFIHEFLDRPDGWPGVKRHYDLPQTNVQGMNHTLAYRALVEKAIDVTEVYTTDGEIAQYDLLVLKDDKNFFPAYEAVYHSYLGIIDSHGLAAFLSEGAVTPDWLISQAPRSRAACFRAVVPDPAADDIRAELTAGHPRDALLLLDGAAVELTPLVESR